MVSMVSACCPLRIYVYTHTEKQVVVSGYPGYQPAFLSVYIYTHIQRNRLWYLGIQGISLLGLSVYIYTHIQRDKQWYQGISLLFSPYISLHTYRETGCGIWVSRVSACCPLCICLCTHTEKQVMVSGYPGYQSAVLSIYIYRHIQRDKRWYLGIQCISMLGFSACIHIHTYRGTSHGIWVSSVSIWWVFMCVSIQTCRETNCSIWVSRVSKCRFCLYWVDNKHTEASGSIRILRVSNYLVFLNVKTYVHRGWP